MIRDGDIGVSWDKAEDDELFAEAFGSSVIV